MKPYTLKEAVALAQELYEEIGRGDRGYPVHVPALFKYVGKKLGKPGAPFKIETVTVEATSPADYRGMLERGDNCAAICLPSSGLNHCWTRFVIFKEAMHLLVDDDDDRKIASVDVQIQEAWEMAWPLDLQPMTSETFAAIVAFETMFPWKHRARLESPPSTLLDEAKKFLVPERYMDVYYRRGYGEISELVNDGSRAKP